MIKSISVTEDLLVLAGVLPPGSERQYYMKGFSPHRGIFVDFAWPDVKLVIEVYDCASHRCSRCGYTPWAYQRNRDIARETFIREQGWHLLVVWQHSVEEFLRLRLGKPTVEALKAEITARRNGS